MHTNIRKWGNSAGAIIPAAALAQAGIAMGDAVEVFVKAGQITFKQAAPEYTLDELLAVSPKGSFALDDSDREWLQDSPVGKELG
jgi:antitoxin component of MazEF toxin-antitoxin module|tara:strand:- start:1673 stop:1927 length:255 start_codon:yes stop_codon:yes gene_type:complete